MTLESLLTPALVAALALNIVSIVWINHAGTEVPQANSRPPPGCVEPATYRHRHR